MPEPPLSYPPSAPETGEPPLPPPGPIRRALMRHPWAFAVAFGLILIPAIRPCMRAVPPPPPVLGQLPEHVLVDQDGAPLGVPTLRGRVWVLGTFYTRCDQGCTKTLDALHALATRFRAHRVPVTVVGLTVDPSHDTPAQLRAYSRQRGAGDTVRLVTDPDPQGLGAFVADGLRMKIGAPRVRADGAIFIPRSDKLVLLDARGRIRGYYGAGKDGVDEVFHRAQHVLAQARDEGELAAPGAGTGPR